MKVYEMTDSTQSQRLRRNSDRRIAADRRHFTYAFYIPERRRATGQEVNNNRRCGMDRRMNEE
jgi:hypothetical protein